MMTADDREDNRTRRVIGIRPYVNDTEHLASTSVDLDRLPASRSVLTGAWFVVFLPSPRGLMGSSSMPPVANSFALVFPQLRRRMELITHATLLATLLLALHGCHGHDGASEATTGAPSSPPTAPSTPLPAPMDASLALAEEASIPPRDSGLDGAPADGSPQRRPLGNQQPSTKTPTFTDCGRNMEHASSPGCNCFGKYATPISSTCNDP
jgi:hypothetical protein